MEKLIIDSLEKWNFDDFNTRYNDIDIDMAGAMALDVGQANGRLYWRVGAAWKYVDATGGLSLPIEERTDPSGHEFQIGDEVKMIVDRINEDGSFHAEPIFAGRN